MTAFDRRSVLKFGSSAALASSTFRAGAINEGEPTAPEPHFFVYVQIYGAWDVCLAFDPKDRNSKLSNGEVAFDQPYDYSEVSQHGPILLAPDGQMFGKYADRMAIINGVDMELDFGHTPMIAMTGTAQPNGNTPFLQAILSQKHPFLRSRLLPHLYGSYDGFFIGGRFTQKTIEASAADAYQIIGAKISAEKTKRSIANTIASAVGLPSQARAKVESFAKAQQQASDLSTQLQGIQLEPPTDPATIAQFVGGLFQLNLLGSFTWSLGGDYNFDTHSQHYEQHPLKRAMMDLSGMLDVLAQIPYDTNRSVLDLTTVFLTGEYCRTPRLNGSNGKDHNFSSNSVVLIGKNVRPAVFGASGEKVGANSAIAAHSGLPIDFATGDRDSSGEILKMRNVLAGAGPVFGVDLSTEFGRDTRAVSFLKV